MDVRVVPQTKLSTRELILNCGVDSPLDCKEIKPVNPKRNQPWSSNTLATWCKELTHWKRPWCWERLKAGEEGDDKGWDGCMASLTRWTWVWVSSGSWWWTGRPGMLQSMGLQRVGHNWASELNWIVNEIVFLISVSDRLLLMCRNVTFLYIDFVTCNFREFIF